MAAGALDHRRIHDGSMVDNNPRMYRRLFHRCPNRFSYPAISSTIVEFHKPGVVHMIFPNRLARKPLETSTAMNSVRDLYVRKLVPCFQQQRLKQDLGCMGGRPSLEYMP